MRGFTVGMLVSVGLLLTAPPALAQGSGASDWSLYWWDDFDGTTLNTAKWTPVDNCDDQRNNEEQCYRAAAVSVSNGSLVITSTRDQYRGFDFTSGAVKTETTFVAEPPVRVEFRARLPRGGWGLWPALWLYPTTTWPPEIDVLEAVNDMHTIWQNYHWGTWPDTQSVLSATWVGTSEAAFHTYAVEWEPDAIRWYVDDTLTKTVTAHVSAVPMQLYINTALGGSWPGPVPASTVFPQTLAVDYVRVYTRGTPDSSVDREGPTVALSSPSAGSFVNGSVMLQAVADDNVGVQAVWFTVDDQSTGGEDTRAPYQRTWDSRTVPNGTHTVRGHARDAAGNTQASAPVTVTVSNAVADTTGPSVAVISPADGSTVSGYLTLSASADDPSGVSRVTFLVDGAAVASPDTTAPYQAMWNASSASTGTHVIQAVGIDGAGNSRTSAPVSVTVAGYGWPWGGGPRDTEAPSVWITSPAYGETTVSGQVTLAAGADDNVGVAGVQFLVNGETFGPEQTGAPYAITWDTTRVANGTYTIEAVARDAAGNRATSWSRTVTVSNTSARGRSRWRRR